MAYALYEEKKEDIEMKSLDFDDKIERINNT